MQTWLFQSVLERYDLLGALQAAPEHGMLISWKTGKYTSRVRRGDRAIIWVSGKAGGVIASGRVAEAPSMVPEESWEAVFNKDPKEADLLAQRARIMLDQVFSGILPVSEVKAKPALSGMSIFRFAQSSAFPVTSEEAVVIEGMISEWAGALADYAEQGAEDAGVEEGRLTWAMHYIRERDRSIVKKKKEVELERAGRLQCEVCGFDFASTYGDHGDGFIECHHKNPLAGPLTPPNTKLKDLALICANCHRMLHVGRLSTTIEQLREIVAGRLQLNLPRR